MAHESRRWIAPVQFAATLALALGWPAEPANAQAAAPGPQIYKCRDPSGRIITTDKLPPGCVSIDKIDSNGAVRGTIEPGMSDSEVAAKQECLRRNEEIRAGDRDKIKRDQLLTQKFPNEQTHRQARAKELDDVSKSVAQSENRIRALMKERKPLLDEAEFFIGKDLPPLLKQKIDSNDALLGAQKTLSQQQQLEAVRINEKFDQQLINLKKLWNGGGAGASPLLNCSAAAIRKDR